MFRRKNQPEDSWWREEERSDFEPIARNRSRMIFLSIVILATVGVGMIRFLEMADRSGGEQVALGLPSLAPNLELPARTSAYSASVPEADNLKAQMLTLINTDRRMHGLSQVAWDETLAAAGQLHAEDMVANAYFSHWNQAGLGPDHRYSLLGGEHSVMENLFAYENRYDNGTPAPIESWRQVIEDAQQGLMDSPGHRANILDPAHTHVGIGIAYNIEAGQVRIAQEFGNHYVELNVPISSQAVLGDELQVAGQIASSLVDNVIIGLAYMPFPEPLSLVELAQTATYRSAAQNVAGWAVENQFQQQISLDDPGRAGVYHIRVFGDISGVQALLLDKAVWVAQP